MPFWVGLGTAFGADQGMETSNPLAQTVSLGALAGMGVSSVQGAIVGGYKKREYPLYLQEQPRRHAQSCTRLALATNP